MMCIGYDLLERRIFLVIWISLVSYLFYETFIFYKTERQFYHLYRILGVGLCIARSSASVVNVCSAIILLPTCKKLNQILYVLVPRRFSRIFFFWLEKLKTFHITVAITLAVFAAIHSISHIVNLWNFSRSYDERYDINFARHKNENLIHMVMTPVGITGVTLLTIIVSMSLTSLRVVRRTYYNAFWYTHRLYLIFVVLLVVHPMSGVLKEEVLEDNDFKVHDIINNSSQIEIRTDSILRVPKFVSIKSMTWRWMVIPLSLFLLDLIWRVLSRNRDRVDIIEMIYLPGGTISLTMACPTDKFKIRNGQYVLLQCQEVSLLEWHPFTIVKVPTSSQREFTVWIRVRGDWTEALAKLLEEKDCRQIRLLVDGPFSGPLQSAMEADIAICIAAGVGITPFVSILRHMLQNPRSRYPYRIHLIWIVRYEQEITWIADLASETLINLRNANRPDGVQLEFYVTSENKTNLTNTNKNVHLVVIDEKGLLKHVVERNNCYNERVTLLTPKNRALNIEVNIKNDNRSVNRDYKLAGEYPLLACRIKRGRPRWNELFFTWTNLYPKKELKVYCCGPKKLVTELQANCKKSNSTRTIFTFIHESFS